MGLKEDLKKKASMIDNFVATGTLKPAKKVTVAKKDNKVVLKTADFDMDGNVTKPTKVEKYVSRYGSYGKNKKK